jgi:hypothetical protein
MQKQEPTLNELDVELANIRFRPRGTTAEKFTVPLWLQIAAGVFIALCAHSVVTWTIADRVLKETVKQLDAEIAAMEKEFATSVVVSPAPRQQTFRTRTLAPLRAGERCIEGKRFRQVPNGWTQIPQQPCR